MIGIQYRGRIDGEVGWLRDLVTLCGSYAAAYLSPFILLPYLTRVLGQELWGELAFYQSFGACIYLFADYGFGLSATRDVAQNCDTPRARGQIVAAVFAARLLIGAGAAAAALAVHLLLPKTFSNLPLLMACTLASVLQALDLVWYFQGIERVHKAATVDIISRGLAMCLCFVLVWEPGHVLRAAFVTAWGTMLSTAVLLWRARGTLNWCWPELAAVRKVFAQGKHVFLMKGAYVLSSAGNVLLLGMLDRPFTVAQFAAAEKVSRGLSSLVGPVSQTFFPRVAKEVDWKASLGGPMMKRATYVSLLAGAALLIAGALFAPRYIAFTLPSGHREAISAFYVMAVVPLLTTITNIYGTQWLVCTRRERVLARIVLIGGVVNVLLACVLVRQFGAVGMAVAVATTNTLISGTVVVYAVSVNKALARERRNGR